MLPRIMTLRAFLRGSEFDPEQLEDSFTEGVYPVLILPAREVSDIALSALADYLIKKVALHGTFPLLADLEGELSGVSEGGKQWVQGCRSAIRSVSRLNQQLAGSGLLIELLTIKPPPLCDYRKMTAKNWNPAGADLLVSPISAQEYFDLFAELKVNLCEIAREAFHAKLRIALENTQSSSYVTRPQESELPPGFLKAHHCPAIDPRYGSALFPWHLQVCPSLPNVESLSHLIADLPREWGTGAMFDAEHWQTTYNYARNHSVNPREVEGFETNFLETFGFLVRKGERIRYREALSPSVAITRFRGMTHGFHINGFPNDNIAFADESPGEGSVQRIAASFPLFLGSRKISLLGSEIGEAFNALAYAVTQVDLREQFGQEIQENLCSLLRARATLANAPHIILEFQIGAGEYSGKRWRTFLRTSKVIIEWALAQCRAK